MVLVTGCGSDKESSDDKVSGEATGTDGVTVEAAELTQVKFVLDWTPNTNHTGLYVAIAKGYFEAAGIEVEILPYSSTSADTLVSTGQADFGVSAEDNVLFARSTGAEVVSVFAVLQHWVTAIGVAADRDDIQSPKDLDGLTYAGFGLPGEAERVAQIIRNDGGAGDIEIVTLGTSAYEAVYSGDADMAEPFMTWEGIEAELRGTPMKFFPYADYGFPDCYNVVITANPSWLESNADTAKAFLGALQQGYEYAAANPEESGQILIDANPGVFSEEELVTKSQAELSANYLLDANGKAGTQTAEQWSGYGSFLYEQGLLSDGEGNPLAAEPDWSTYFTSDYLPS
jgi:ABC-type nitrate/sulfonate/bicarbonate transport system substrate-binding protein